VLLHGTLCREAPQGIGWQGSTVFGGPSSMGWQRAYVRARKKKTDSGIIFCAG